MYNAKFNCAIISSNPEATQHCCRELATFDSIGEIDCLPQYPELEVVTRMLRLNAVDLLLIDCEDLPRALEIIEVVRAKDANMEIVAICPEEVKILSTLMRAGVQDYLPTGASTEAYREILATSVDKLHSKPRQPVSGGDIFAFLPSKPGSGASTIVAHTALRASRTSKKRVLLADFDRDAPVQAFLNCLRPDHFLQEALTNSHKMDADIWGQLISQRGELDILPADADGEICTDAHPTREILGFARRAYDLVCVDLPGPMDAAASEVLTEAKRVYLVCTQELASVHIAMRKADRLKRLGLSKEIRVVLNRYVSSDPMTQDRIADLVGLPVELTIPNSYALATASAEKGAHVDPGTPLGKSYTRLAQILLNDRPEIPRKGNRFIETLFQPFVRREGRAV
ncbi:MAG TPA: hypothetical protein VGK29_04590 [Paludibaculum sp.]|jgi:pilus assembly protein CpaE